MTDVIEGIVLGVVNGASLEVRVDEFEPPISGRYAALEYIRLIDGGDSAGKTLEGAADLLGAVLQNCRIRCHVESRDHSGQLVGRIEVVDPEPTGNDEFIEPRSFAEDG